MKKLKNKTLHWEQALNEIERFFKSKPKKIAHVLLIDEVNNIYTYIYVFFYLIINFYSSLTNCVIGNKM